MRIPTASHLVTAFRQRLGWAERILLIGFSLVLLLCLGEVLFGDSPWTEEVVARLEAGEKLKIRERIAIGFRGGVWTVLGLSIVALGSSPWWALKRETREWPARAVIRPPTFGRGMFYTSLAVIVGIAAWIRLPMLDHSFWNDEELAFRKFVWGEYRPVEESAAGDFDLEFRPVPWDYAFFYSISGNNHVAQTVLSKLTHETWMRLAGIDRERPVFFEAAARIGPLGWALVTIVAIAMALRSIGHDVAGLLCAGLLTVHPWHADYSIEARGYSGMLCFVLMSFWLLAQALRTPKWKWWIGFGAAQCLYLLHFAGSVYLALATNVIVFSVLLAGREGYGLRRWFVANLLSAMAVIIIMAPSVAAILTYLTESGARTSPLGGQWFLDLWMHLSAGMPAAGGDASVAWGASLAEWAEDARALALFWQWLLPVAVGAGLWYGARQHRGLLIAVVACLISAALAIGHSAVKGTFLMEWYLLHLMLLFVLGLALFVVAAGSAIARLVRIPESRQAAACLALALAVAGGFALATQRELDAVRNHDLQPLRQVVERARGVAPAIDGKQRDVLSLAIGPGADQYQSYDPRVVPCQERAELDAQVEDARTSDRELWLYINSPEEMSRRSPDLHAAVYDSDRFEPVETFKGVNAFWCIELMHLKRS